MKPKKRGKRNYHKKKVNMKSPLIVTGVILVLFVILIIFSVLNGPVEKEVIEEKESTPKEDMIERVKEIRKENGNENPSIRINKAIASKDISICESNEQCEIDYIFATAETDADCDQLRIDLRGTCKERL